MNFKSFDDEENYIYCIPIPNSQPLIFFSTVPLSYIVMCVYYDNTNIVIHALLYIWMANPKKVRLLKSQRNPKIKRKLDDDVDNDIDRLYDRIFCNATIWPRGNKRKDKKPSQK